MLQAGISLKEPGVHLVPRMQELLWRWYVQPGGDPPLQGEANERPLGGFNPICKRMNVVPLLFCKVFLFSEFLRACSRPVVCITYSPAVLWLIIAAHVNEPSLRRWKRACQQLFAAHC